MKLTNANSIAGVIDTSCSDQSRSTKLISEAAADSVVSVEKGCLVQDAHSKMIKNSVTCAVVIDANKFPVGVCTGRDVSRLISDGKDIANIKIEEVMRGPVHTIPVRAPVYEAAQIMEQKEVLRLVAIDDNEAVAGIVTLSAIARLLRDNHAGPGNNASAEFIRIEEKTRELEAKYRSIVSTSKDAIMLIDSVSGMFIEVNGACEQLYGYSKEEFLNGIRHDAIAAVKDNTEEFIIQACEREMAGTAFRYHKKKNGTVFPVEVSVSKLEIQGRKVFCGIVRDISGIKQAEKQLDISQKERDVLLNELHHRVRNNLQLIYSLLNLQKDFAEDNNIRDVIEEHQNRIRAISLVHENLYHADELARINLRDYVNELVNKLLRFYEVDTGRIMLNIDVDDIVLDVSHAIPFGLIISEIVAATLQGNLSGESNAEIKIMIRSVNEKRISLGIYDNGSGLSEYVDLSSNSAGLHVVKTLVKHLKGEINIDKSGGSLLQIEFRRGK